MFLVHRTAADGIRLAAPARQQIWSIDKDQPVEDARMMEERIAGYNAPRRFYMLLLCMFAAVAVALAAVGIYGVISYSVSQRYHEIGIRMALGAQQADVLKLVAAKGFVLTLIGEGIGIFGALWLTRFLTNLLYGVRVTDFATYAVVSTALAVVALLASYIPARRATKVDPMATLRHG
jgi:putative ABC transport system permease protein